MVRDCGKKESKNCWGESRGRDILQPSTPSSGILARSPCYISESFFPSPLLRNWEPNATLIFQKGHFGFLWQSCAHLACLPLIHLPSHSNGTWQTQPISVGAAGTNGWYHSGSVIPEEIVVSPEPERFPYHVPSQPLLYHILISQAYLQYEKLRHQKQTQSSIRHYPVRQLLWAWHNAGCCQGYWETLSPSRTGSWGGVGRK